MYCRALEEARSLPVVTVRRRCNEICIDVQAATARCDPHVAIYGNRSSEQARRQATDGDVANRK